MSRSVPSLIGNDSYPCPLALDLIFLRESAKPFSPVGGQPTNDQLPALGYVGKGQEGESGESSLVTLKAG